MIMEHVVSPTEWGAQINYDKVTWRPWNPDKIIGHWGGSPVSDLAASGDIPAEKAQLRAWENYHLNHPKYTFVGIAYNYAVGNSGTLYRLRGENRSGATAGDDEPDGIPENHEGCAVVFIVGQGQQVTQTAFSTFAAFYAEYGVDTVIGHKDVDIGPGYGTVTSCPGPQIHAYIQNKGYLELGGTNVLQKGSKGNAVEYFQEALIGWDSNALPKYGADGDFGGETEAWVKNFQAAQDLSQTGAIDGVTAALLDNYHPDSGGGSIPADVLRVGDVGVKKHKLAYIKDASASHANFAETSTVSSVTIRGVNV